MEAIHNFGAFLTACILLNITPGSDTILILSKSIAQGKKAGIVTALGITIGTLGHTLLAAFGLSILIAKSIMLFNIIKYAGAAYIVYLGIKMIRADRMVSLESGSKATFRMSKLFRDGFLTNILNPKVALFFIAFLPQFIDPAEQSAGVLPFLLLGLTFMTTGMIYCSFLAVFAAVIFARLRESERFSVGAVLVSLGAYVALMRR